MKCLQISVYWFLLTITMLALGSTGCGNGISNPMPYSSITATQNPLVAQYNLTIPYGNSSAWVEFGPDTHYGRQTSAVTTTGVWQPATILVAGMLPSTTYHMRAHIDWGGGSWVDQDQTFKTGAIPRNLIAPTFTVTRPDASLTPSPGVELLDLVNQLSTANQDFLNTLVTDLNGNPIWYYDVGPANLAFPVRPMSNGHFIVGISPQSILREIDLAGNTIREIGGVPQINASLQAKGYSFTIGDLHHDVLALPTGDWIAIGQTTKTFTNLPGYPGSINILGDVLIDLDLNGNVAWAWSTFDHLDVNRHPLGLPDWTHGNALVYTPNDGNLLFSMRDQSWIVKIDYENGSGTGDILWRLGEDGDITLAGGEPSQWFYGQHFPNLLSQNGPQMIVAIFDDGNNRVLDDHGDICGTPGNVQCYSRGTIYQIDESTLTASLLWQDLPALFTFWGGSIEQFSNGQVELDLSEPNLQNPNSSQVMEVTGTTSPQLVWQMLIQGANAYRGYRIPSLYPGVTWQQ
jgi:arylsulfate sulfotransferase